MISGDVLHVEPISKDHTDENNQVVFSFTQQYFLEKHNQLIVDIEETTASYKRRTSNNTKPPTTPNNTTTTTTTPTPTPAPTSTDQTPMEITTSPTTNNTTNINNDNSNNNNNNTNTVDIFGSKWINLNNKLFFKLATNKSHTLQQLKYIIYLITGISNRQQRIYAKYYSGHNDGKLLKDTNAKLSQLLQRFSGSPIITDLMLEVLQVSEDLRKVNRMRIRIIGRTK